MHVKLNGNGCQTGPLSQDNFVLALEGFIICRSAKYSAKTTTQVEYVNSPGLEKISFLPTVDRLYGWSMVLYICGF